MDKRRKEEEQAVDEQLHNTPPINNKPSDQMLRRQSAPHPTVEDEVRRIEEARMAQGGMMQNPSAANGFNAIAQKVGREQVQAAYQTLLKYKEGKANLERKIIENEQWFKIRHWECMRDKEAQVQPSSGWLLNAILNKHADAMDNFPAPNILPRAEDDREEAGLLTSIIPVILDQDDFEQTYDDVTFYKLKGGTGVYGVFWDNSKHNGLGDVAIKKIDLLNLFWESGITDIQKSRNVFHVELKDIDLVKEMYPNLGDKVTQSTIDVAKYQYDDKVDTTNKAAVIDWYYRKNENGRTVLHYCKFVGDEVLFATENDPQSYPNGWYDDGQYPFVFDALFPIEGTPCGFGYIDIGKDAQSYIDRVGQAILENTLANAKPRHFVRTDGAVNEDEYLDTNKPLVHVDGNLGQDSIMPIQTNNLPQVYVEVLNRKIDELKEVTGNRDISTGGTSSGVTAASAIAAMQEAGSKLSRDDNKASYRAFRRLIVMVIERIRQFYDLPRCFRIMGQNGMERYVTYSNQNISPQMQGIEMGVDMGYRVPYFDVEITAQKQSPYSKMSQNELALQFYNAGFFNPQMADQALACLDMMDFDRKQFIIQKVSQNGGMYQQLMQMQQQMLMLAQMVDQSRGSNIAEQMAAGINGEAPPPAVDGSMAGAENTQALGGVENKEAVGTKKARQRVAESTSPT